MREVVLSDKFQVPKSLTHLQKVIKKEAEKIIYRKKKEKDSIKSIKQRTYRIGSILESFSAMKRRNKSCERLGEQT